LLVPAGHVTILNLGGKKYVGREGGQIFFIVAGHTLWFSNPRAVAKNQPLCRGLKSNFANEECYIISAVNKI